MRPADKELVTRTREMLADGTARDLREHHGLSRSQVAAAISAQPHTLYLWERGSHSPSPAYAIRLGRFLRKLEKTAEPEFAG